MFLLLLSRTQKPEKVKKYITRKNKSLRLENEMKSLYKRFTRVPLEYFGSVALSDIDELERTFNLGIQIYTYDANLCFARLKRRANPNYNDVMYLDLTEEEGMPYFRYIHDMKACAPYYRCNKCSQLWRYASRCTRHEVTCSAPFSSARSKSKRRLFARTASKSAV